MGKIKKSILIRGTYIRLFSIFICVIENSRCSAFQDGERISNSMIIDGCYCHARARPIDSRPPARGSSPLFLFSDISLLSKRNSLLSWRRRLGERWPSPLPATSASSRYVAPAPSLSLCYARRSTPNPNKTICIRI